MPDLGIQGLQKAQSDNANRIANLKTGRVLEDGIRGVLIVAHRYAISITHVWRDRGGGLRASHRMKMNGARGQVYIDPAAVNPRGQRVSSYAPAEHARGGDHAFYARTVKEADSKMRNAAVAAMRPGLEQGKRL